MAYRYGNREQLQLLPQSIEEYVASDDPVRVYDAFVESLDIEELGIVLEENKVGNTSYYPRSMIKLLVYGTSYGKRSSRKLERATYHNFSFIWLMGGLTPDHKTIARFRKDNRKALKKILKQCAMLCIKLGLIEGNTLFVDGSKIRANAGIKNTWTQERCEKYLKHLDIRIESILSECEEVDGREEGNQSLVKLKDELKDKKALKSKIEAVMKELQEKDVESINTVDPDCVKVKGRAGIHVGYNSQVVVDEKHGLIVHSEVVNESNDLNQFANQIEQSNEILGQKCKNACADAGYANTEELKKIDDESITVIVPSQRQAHNRPVKPFSKEQFHYNAQEDCYICPHGHLLTYSHFCKEKQHRVYQIQDGSLCQGCQHFGVCTRSKYGRRIRRLVNEEVKLKLEEQYRKEESQVIYKLRKEKVELTFGHIKRNLGVNAFLMRGLEGVKAEMSLLSSCFNIARMITLMGVPALIARLAG